MFIYSDMLYKERNFSNNNQTIKQYKVIIILIKEDKG